MGAKCCRSAGDYVAVDNAEGTGEADHTPPNGQFAAHSVGCLDGTRPSVAQVLLAAPQNNYTGWEGGRPITTSQILSDSTVHALCLSHGAPTQVEKTRIFSKLQDPVNFLVTTISAAESYQMSQQSMGHCVAHTKELRLSREALGQWHDPGSVVDGLDSCACQQAKYAAETILRYYPDLEVFQPIARDDIAGMSLIHEWVRVLEFISRF